MLRRPIKTARGPTRTNITPVEARRLRKKILEKRAARRRAKTLSGPKSK